MAQKFKPNPENSIEGFIGFALILLAGMMFGLFVYKMLEAFFSG